MRRRYSRVIRAGCTLKDAKTEPLAQDGDRTAETVTVAEHSDTVVLILGLDKLLEGEAPDDGNSMEAGDKTDLMLPAVQQKLMERILAVGKPTVVVLLAGSAIDLLLHRKTQTRCFWPGTPARGRAMRLQICCLV